VKVGDNMEEIWRLFPDHLASKLKQETMKQQNPLEEIRLRIGDAVELIFLNSIVRLDQYHFTSEDSMYLLNQLSEHSLYRMQQELKEGYITTTGGHRVGLAGAVVTSSGTIKQIQHITFFNIRIAKEMKGIANELLTYLRDGKTYYNTLLIGVPQTGKTTILRDLARLISNGHDQIPSYKVGIVDERSEIAAAYQGIPQHDIGKRTDVMDACPKADGLMMMIRSMSPDVLMADEIGSLKDVQALTEAMTAGVTIFSTVHGNSLSTVKKRPTLEKIFSLKMFSRYIVLSRHKENCFSFQVVNGAGSIVHQGDLQSS